MPDLVPEITPEIADWIREQKMFFVSTAPLAPNGHINNSPKGGDALRILSSHQVIYQDYTGSGAETIAHLRENGRILIMFCAFQGPPRIVRLHGKGTVISSDDPRYTEFTALFPENPGTRAFILIDVTRVSKSCGFSVPFYDYKSNRDALDRWATQKGSSGLATYRAQKNTHSIDGLPAIPGPCND